jgi:hypothetical protein
MEEDNLTKHVLVLDDIDIFFRQIFYLLVLNLPIVSLPTRLVPGSCSYQERLYIPKLLGYLTNQSEIVTTNNELKHRLSCGIEIAMRETKYSPNDDNTSNKGFDGFS